MRNYQFDTYGERLAADYDQVYADLEPPESQVSLLGELARGGTAIELGVGTVGWRFHWRDAAFRSSAWTRPP